jgi:hypothetical protein
MSHCCFKKGDIVKHSRTNTIMIVTDNQPQTSDSKYPQNFIGVRQLKGELKSNDWFIASDALELMV